MIILFSINERSDHKYREVNLYTFLQILSVTAFEKTHILQVLRDFSDTEQQTVACNQLKLFNL